MISNLEDVKQISMNHWYKGPVRVADFSN